MKITRQVQVEIEIDDEDNEKCSHGCSFLKPKYGGTCFFFDEYVSWEKPTRTERCKKKFSVTE